MRGIPGQRHAVERHAHPGAGQGDADVPGRLEGAAKARHFKSGQTRVLPQQRCAFGQGHPVRRAAARQAKAQIPGATHVLQGHARAAGMNDQFAAQGITSDVAPPAGPAVRRCSKAARSTL